MSAPLCLAAIDPGLTGAVAFYFPITPDRVSIFDMPLIGSEVEHASLARLLRQHEPAFALVEQVGPMPRDGAVQAFRFGAAYAAAKVTVGLVGILRKLCEAPAQNGQAEGVVMNTMPSEGEGITAIVTPSNRRTNADKRRDVLSMLDAEPGLSDREIARRCGVSPQTASTWRKRLSGDR